MSGYILDANGACISSCNVLTGSSIAVSNNTCSLCKDAYCKNCSVNVLICTFCDIFYVLIDGKCQLNCSN